MPAKKITPESAVRDYLSFLRDPSSVPGPTPNPEVKNLEKKIAASKDVLEEAQLRTLLEQTNRETAPTYEADFIGNVKKYLDESGTSPSALLSMFEDQRGKRTKLKRALEEAGVLSSTRKAQRGGGTTRPRVSTEDFFALLPNGEFTRSQVKKAVDKAKGTNLGDQTVGNKLTELEKQGRVTSEKRGVTIYYSKV